MKGLILKVYMLKDIEKIGMAGQIINVSDGYAKNYLLPRNLAKEVKKGEESFFKAREQKEVVKKEVLGSKIAMLAERIKNMRLTIKEKTHDNGKLYGAVGADEVVELLKNKEVSISKKQVEFEKAIKEVGDHKVIIRLTSKLKPQLSLTVVAK